MIALALIGIGLGSAILAMSTAVGWVKEMKNRQFALHTAREHMEIIRTSGFGALAGGTHTYTNRTQGSTTFETDYTVVVSGVNTNIKDLAVKVVWAKTTDSTATNELQLITTVSNSMN
jgi:type II secretory pathway pseudopilin PulG